MSDKPFLDTNVIVYAFATGDPRGAVAEGLLAAGGVTSVQVLNEFVNVSRKKLGRGWPEIVSMLGVLRVLLGAPLPLTVALHEAAVKLASARGFSFYDALIVAAAKQAKCETLYSEDMQDGRVVDGVTIRNPFSSI